MTAELDTQPGAVVLIGCGGMLGRAWTKLLADEGLATTAVDYPQVDLTDASDIARVVGEGTGTVINCAAYTDVDEAETHEAAALALNGTAVATLAARCRAVGATLVHYSTDYVFNGQATRPYTVDKVREPLNAYGRTKAAGEKALETSGCCYLLVRTSWLYAPWGKNFVGTIARLASQRSTLRVVNDQRGRPTSAQHLAATSLALLRRGATGTYHVTDGGECTWYELAAVIVANADAACAVEPCTTAEFPRPAARPAYSVLDLLRTEQLLGPMPPWRDNLRLVMAELTDTAYRARTP